MSIQNSSKYSLGKDLIASQSKLETACVINEELDNSIFNIIWIKEGKGKYLIDFNSVEIEGNTIFFLNPRQVFHVESEHVSEAYQIGFSQDFHCVEKHNSDIACNGILFNTPGETPYIKLDSSQVQKFEMLFQNIFNEFQQNEAGKSDMLQSYLRMILVEATRIKSKQQQIREKELDEGLRLISVFNRLVEKHYKKYHAVADYARLIGISPKSISKQFKAANKDKPTNIIQDRIILEAKRMLLYSDASTKEICYELGFEDPSYFSRLFKKKVSVSPQNFRKSNRLVAS